MFKSQEENHRRSKGAVDFVDKTTNTTTPSYALLVEIGENTLQVSLPEVVSENTYTYFQRK